MRNYMKMITHVGSINLSSVESYNVDLIKKEEDRRGIQW